MVDGAPFDSSVGRCFDPPCLGMFSFLAVTYSPPPTGLSGFITWQRVRIRRGTDRRLLVDDSLSFLVNSPLDWR